MEITDPQSAIKTKIRSANIQSTNIWPTAQIRHYARTAFRRQTAAHS